MGFYTSSDQFYNSAQALFSRLLLEIPGAAEPVEKAKLLMLFRCSDPDSTFLINGRRRPAQVEFGIQRIRPEIEAALSTDTLHYIMLGELSLKEAITSNALKVRGSLWKLSAMAELFQACQAVYPEILQQQGLVSER